MVKDYGNKYICFECGCKFYDLKKKVALCPKCGADQEVSHKKRKGRGPSKSAGKKSAAKRQKDALEGFSNSEDDDLTEDEK